MSARTFPRRQPARLYSGLLCLAALAGWMFVLELARRAQLQPIWRDLIAAAQIVGASLLAFGCLWSFLRRDRREFEDLAAQLRDMADLAADAIILINERGIIQNFNRAATRLFGYSAQEAIGANVSMLMPEPDRSRHDSYLQSYRKSGEAQVIGRGREVIGRRSDGATFSLYLSVSEIGIGGRRAYLGFLHDLTALKERERELARKSKELERSNEDLEQFAYVASHDLQEPLRMVGSYVQLLARRYRGKLDADADEFIEFAVEGAERMQSMINDLLAYSRVGRGQPKRSQLKLNVVLEQALKNLSMSIKERSAQIEIPTLPELPGDETLLILLFQNLIGNALKFTLPEQQPTLKIVAQERGDFWRLAISDNGIGIDPRHQSRIFVLFQRLNDRQSYAGTGIGLAICKKIVELHGGAIGVESAPGQGSTFYFTLPRSVIDGEHVRSAKGEANRDIAG
ncbi:MAG: PAS domain S-box protein [Leptospirales bacterium]|nr:PAS domain S-box protein [Leptospirales bacterium]